MFSATIEETQVGMLPEGERITDHGQLQNGFAEAIRCGLKKRVFELTRVQYRRLSSDRAVSDLLIRIEMDCGVEVMKTIAIIPFKVKLLRKKPRYFLQMCHLPQE